jgi:putative transposase
MIAQCRFSYSRDQVRGSTNASIMLIDDLYITIKIRCFESTLIHHSNRGFQYPGNNFQALLKTNGIQYSMSRKRDYWDNAVAKSFLHTLKVELTHGKSYNTGQKPKMTIFEYIEGFYNRQLHHSYLDYLRLGEYGKKYGLINSPQI